MNPNTIHCPMAQLKKLIATGPPYICTSQTLKNEILHRVKLGVPSKTIVKTVGTYCRETTSPSEILSNTKLVSNIKTSVRKQKLEDSVRNVPGELTN